MKKSLKLKIFWGISAAMGLLLAVFVFSPAVAGYYATLKVIESVGTDYTMAAFSHTVDVDFMETNHYITATGLDTRVTTGAGTAQKHMMVDDRIMFATAIDGSKDTNLLFKTGQTTLPSFPVVVGNNGYFTVTDAPALELGNNFAIDIDGYYKTSTVTGAYCYKDDAFGFYTNGAGSVKASILGTSATARATGHNDPDVAWLDAIKTRDNNIGTTGYNTIPSLSWGNFLYHTFAATDIASIRVYASNTPGWVDHLDLDYYDGAWHDVYEDSTYPNSAWYTISLPGAVGNVTQIRFRFYNSDAGGPRQGAMWEVDFDALNVACSVTKAVASGEHDIIVSADTVNLSIAVDGGAATTQALGGASVPGNANNYLFMQGNTLPYVDLITMTISGTEQARYAPVDIIAGTTLPDETNAYDGTITFGTNPAGIATSLGIWYSDGQPLPAGGAGAGNAADMMGTGGQYGWTDDPTELTTQPFYPFVKMIADNTNMSTQMVWIIGATLIVVAAMAMCFKLVPHQLITVVVGGGLTTFFVAMGIYPFWVIFIFAVGGLAILLWERTPSV